MHEYCTIASFIEGNAWGIVEAPKSPHRTPRKKRGEKWRMKIGPVDPKKPCTKREFQSVIDQLKAYL